MERVSYAKCLAVLLCLLPSACLTEKASGQISLLQDQLAKEDPEQLIKDARSHGDAKRGAVVFFQPYMSCAKCHIADDAAKSLGPDLARFEEKVTAAHLLESVLHPSKKIRKGYDSTVILTEEGKTLTGLLVKDEPEQVTIRDIAMDGKLVTIDKDTIEAQKKGETSIMPAGLVNQLTGRQQFLDLLRYLIEISEGGPLRAAELRPDPSLIAARPIPEYEKTIDHAGMIADLDRAAFKRGEAIYNRLCINCHGNKQRPGSLPTSLRFAEGKFKSGSDPFTMYQTLTRGFGMMVQQAWMVPQQKYDVIHYIREEYLKKSNPSQYFDVTETYLAGLPKGDSRGPAPQNIQPWIVMDYGSSLIHTYEIGKDATNFAYKGIATRVDPGPGGVSRGRHWMVFDHDTLRMAAAWSGKGFIDWNGIMFNGRHNIHPRIAGTVAFENPTGPGWANPETGDFDDPRLKGRDGRRYGPLPREWAHYKGLYHHGDKTIVSYTVGETKVLETTGLAQAGTTPVFTRTFNIGPRKRDMILQVAHRDGARVANLAIRQPNSSVVRFGSLADDAQTAAARKPDDGPVPFDGATRVEISDSKPFEMRDRDFTIFARIKTRAGGTIFSQTAPNSEWVRDGKTFFIRGGRLCYDIGWVGVVQSNKRVHDGKWHDVAMTFDHESGQVRLFVDGAAEGGGTLKAKSRTSGHIVRIGYTAGNFPKPSAFQGEISDVHFYDRALSGAEIKTVSASTTAEGLVAHWDLTSSSDGLVKDRSKTKHDGRIVRGTASKSTKPTGSLLAGVISLESADWQSENGNLRLRIPAGDQPIRFTLWLAALDESAKPGDVTDTLVVDHPAQDLSMLTQGGPARWPAKLTTQAMVGSDDGPFAVDVLTRPAANPWNCRVRLTGLDFFKDGKRAALSAWDGDVWIVEGIDRPEQGLTWQRIASGLFQPLGVRVIDGKIHLTCRDQLVVLHDLNGDGETDYYENLNNDHQVTEHFHEFAMGLQTDEEGNFYYAKSARHALPAVVPHHGTLLKVSKDGSKTEILATGFRAANGVCLNPDGTFIVTDQEGHWNPKNRINWVKRGGFYGNMYGYHDVTDESDDAMEQPLCWITNSFDRSPAELLWVDSERWGPLNGTLLNLSYGYGMVYVVPHESIDGQMQGGMCALPIPRFPTGVMRGRFHPGDGQLYLCGMFAWAGSQSQPGGFYRLRYTGQPVHLPVGLNATEQGMKLTFSGDLDPQTATDVRNYAVKTWSLKRTKNYGSKHYNEQRLKITAASLSNDGKTVLLEMPDIEPTWCMEIRYSLKGAGGENVTGVVHNTIHHLGRPHDLDSSER